MMSLLQRMVTDAVMHDDVHVAEDGHRCCVLTIMQYDVHVAEDGHICCVMTIMQDDVTDAV